MGTKARPAGEIDPLLNVDLDSEWYLGATNINGTVGNGSLTAGISLWGELTVLRWPRVSHFDQLRYLTAHGVPLRNYRVRSGPEEESEIYRRWGRPVVLKPGMGSFGGVFVEGAAATNWFHLPDWEPSQRYEPADGNILVTESRNPRLDLSVTVTDVVHPSRDLMARRFVLECGAGAPESEGLFVYFANLSPTMTRARYYPVTWRLHERSSDYMAVYDERRDLVLHFRPCSPDRPRPAAEASRLAADPARLAELVDGIDSRFGDDGVFIAWGLGARSSGRVLGDARGSKAGGGSAFRSADSCILVGPLAAARPAASALSRSMSLGPGARSEVTVYFAFAPSGSKAIGLLERAREDGFDNAEKASRRHWSAFSRATRVPPLEDERAREVARRGILALAVGTDATSGAVVASVSRQPQYCFDWSRDGAFFDYALDVAGHHEAVTRHAGFYTAVQIRGGRSGRGAGHFRGHYYADGRSGSIPFVEIDETGLAAWDLWRHARYLEPPEREDYLARVYPSIRMAADALMVLRPRGGGFQRRAREDDNLLHRTSTLHGAASTFLGLDSAVRAGRQANEQAGRVATWEEWAAELRGLMISSYDPALGRFAREGWRGGTWLVWPARILGPDDERIHAQAEHLMRDVERFVDRQGGGTAYAAERLVACAQAWRGEPGKLERVKRALGVIASEAVTPGTGHLGEVTLLGDFAGDGQPVYQNRTSIPHLWEGTLLYLAFVAAYAPEWMDFADGPFSW